MSDTNKRIEEIKGRLDVVHGKWKTAGGYAPIVFEENEKFGDLHICDVRGWGHFTGTLGLDETDATIEQEKVVEFIANAPQDIRYLLWLVDHLTKTRRNKKENG